MLNKPKIYYYRIYLLGILYISLALFSSVLAQETSPQVGFGGVGIQITLESGRFVILGVLPNTPADQAEIPTGSTIVAIDGEQTAGKSLEEVVSKLRGEVGASVRLSILSPGARVRTAQPREIELNRGFIPLPAPTPISEATSSSAVPSTELGENRGTITYYLITIPKSGQITVGSPLLIRLMVDNPKGIYADTIAIWLNFNPQIFSCSNSAFSINTSLIDGWTITTTALDAATGKFHLEFRTTTPKLVKSGYVAELRLIPKQVTNETSLSYSFNDWGKYPNTAVLCRDKDILGSEFDHKDGTIGTRLRINKE